MKTEQLVVINGAKAIARAYRRWMRSPTTENQHRLDSAEHRLDIFVARLEAVEEEERLNQRAMRSKNIKHLKTVNLKLVKS